MRNVEDLGILSGTDQLNCALVAGRDNALEGLWMSETDCFMLHSFYVLECDSPDAILFVCSVNWDLVSGAIERGRNPESVKNGRDNNPYHVISKVLAGADAWQ